MSATCGCGSSSPPGACHAQDHAVKLLAMVDITLATDALTLLEAALRSGREREIAVAMWLVRETTEMVDRRMRDIHKTLGVDWALLSRAGRVMYGVYPGLAVDALSEALGVTLPDREPKEVTS